MGLVLNISKERADQIIHREVTRVLRSKGLYALVYANRPAYCPFPDPNGRDLDLDYQHMDLTCDYAIGQDEVVSINNIVCRFPVRALEFNGMHENPYARPGRGPVFNLSIGQVDHVRITLPESFDLNLWEDDEGTWDGQIEWESLELDPSMIAFVNR